MPCPITGGIKTTIAIETFAWMCNNNQSKQTKWETGYYLVCEQCLGKFIPDEVIFKKLEDMTLAIKENKTCEQCGIVKPVILNHGKDCCSVCATMRGSVKLRPESVVDAIREFHGSLEKFLSPGEVSNIRSGIDAGFDQKQYCSKEDFELIKNENDSFEKSIKALQSQAVSLRSTIAELRKDKEGLEIIGRNQHETLCNLTSRNKKLEGQLVELQKENEWYEKKNAQESAETDGAGSVLLKSQLDSATLRLSEAMLEIGRLKKEASLIRAQGNNQYDKTIIGTLTMDLAQASIEGKFRLTSAGFAEMRKLSGL